MATTKKREPEAPVCRHFQRAADLLGKRWNTQIIRALLSGESRFTDVRDGVPSLSDALLSERLKELEAEGIVTRTVTPTTPVRIEYGLTEAGRDLAAVMDELAAWAERWARTDAGVGPTSR
jgi:DNA-binding HxlR family transcriptional regulator